MTQPALAAIPEASDAVAGSASIKDVYCEWLRGVDALTRKRRSKKTRKRLVALQRLTKPTESSASKRHQAPEAVIVRGDAGASSEAALDAQRRRFRLLADEANYTHFSYETPWVPGLGFFALLATQAASQNASGPARHSSSHTMRRELPNFPVRVPTTVLRLQHPSRSVVVIFTVEQQREPEHDVFIKPRRSGMANSGSSKELPMTATDWTLQLHYFNTREMFESRLPWIVRALTPNGLDSESSTIAVLKCVAANGNDLKALTSHQSIEDALLSLWEQTVSAADCWSAVQMYVTSKGTSGSGTGKAWIARPAYRKKDLSATSVWIITGNDSLFATTAWSADTSSSPPCQIVRCTTAQSWQAPRVIVETLCQWLDVQLLRPSGVGTLAELVIDLVQDAQGTWWLLQVKAFQLRRSQLPQPVGSRARSAPDRLETSSLASMSSKASSYSTKFKWKCTGKYCHHEDDSVFAGDNQTISDEPGGYLTKKELLSCEFYDRFRASDDASLSGGCNTFLSALQFYLQHQLHKRDRTILYEPQSLCSTCIRQYYSLRAGMASLVEAEAGRNNTKANVAVRLTKANPLTAKSFASFPTATPLTSKLPALTQNRTLLRGSHSTPEISNSTSAPSYMDELERIEKLLADPLQHQSQDRKALAQPATTTTLSDRASITHAIPLASASEDAQAMTFSWQDRATNRVDQMWESIALKPLTHLSNTKVPTANEKTSHVYNTFSLESALREVAMASPLHAAKQNTEDHNDPYHISLTDCRRVFSDESFRDSLVQETTQRLVAHRQPVRFVVLPTEQYENSEHDTSQQLALGRMALRTLALDIDQLLTQEGVAITRGLPPIHGDSAGNGCLFMLVPVPPL